MNEEQIWLLINTLESVSIVATENNLSRMLASIQLLKKAAKEMEEVKKDGR